MKKLLAFWLALCPLGCTSPNNPPDSTLTPHTADSVMQQVHVQEATHKKTITFPSLLATQLPNYQDVTGIRAEDAPTTPYGIMVVQKPHTPDMYLVYMSTNKDSGPLDQVQAENGHKLPFVSMNQPVDTGNAPPSLAASVGLQINLAFLEKNHGRNPQIKVFDKQGSFVIFLPDYYIDGVLQYLRQH